MITSGKKVVRKVKKTSVSSSSNAMAGGNQPNSTKNSNRNANMTP